MNAPRETIVLVGDRRRALRGARAARASIVQVVHDAATPARRGIEHRLVVSRHAAPSEWAAAAAALAAHRPCTVLPLSEAAVVPAARMRAALGVAHGAGSVEGQVDTALRCTDKLLMKAATAAAGVPCAELIEGDDRVGGPELAERLGVPFVVKPRVGSGGRGARWVAPGVPTDFVLPVGWIAERAVDGTEMSVEALVRDGEPLFVNFTEYLELRWANVVPAEIEPGLAASLRELLGRVLVALGVRDGFVHMEVFCGRRGPVLGELAWRPPGGHIMELIELAYGFDPWRAWIEASCGREPRIVRDPTRSAAVRLFHPGPGVVASAPARDALRDIAGVESFRVRVAAGSRLEPRIGSGQEAAHVAVSGADRAEAVARLAGAAGLVRIELRPD